MSTSKHPLSGHQPNPPPRDDLQDNPGIKTSPGATRAGEDPDLIEGDNTVEGDIAEDTTAVGGADPKHRGHDHPKH